ncbi:phosphoadenosine phosphosulfate reductase family protein [Niabella sp.]|uniref:phosphoadenosine phosphosulfate reductase domain-containing protein n=1 Tax=Niabella sp. TaxID=1962976 RepID=UPI002601A8C7|nr:phosphoadenosine phosphosulfate reductase family protein [Niabella sp.]
MKDKLLISFSGGRTSAFMTWWLLQNMKDKFEMMVVFANTGKEREETLRFVERCDKKFGFNLTWIEAVTHYETGKGVTAKVVNFHTASRNGEPFEAFIRKHGIPNMGAPKCSRELKGYAIRAYARSCGWKGYYTAIGIRADETHRINIKTMKRNRIIYPLATLIQVTKSDINLFWSKQDFDLELKSYEGNCDLCWKKSLRKLMTIVSENPQLVEWWRTMEQHYENFIPDASKNNPKIKPPLRFYRDNMTTDEIVEDATYDFEPAIDESKMIDEYKQLAFFNEWYDREESGCTQSCEAF